MKVLTLIVMVLLYTVLACAAMAAFMYTTVIPLAENSWFDAIVVIFVSEIVGLAVAAGVYLTFHPEAA